MRNEFADQELERARSSEAASHQWGPNGTMIYRRQNGAVEVRSAWQPVDTSGGSERQCRVYVDARGLSSDERTRASRMDPPGRWRTLFDIGGEILAPLIPIEPDARYMVALLIATSTSMRMDGSESGVEFPNVRLPHMPEIDGSGRK